MTPEGKVRTQVTTWAKANGVRHIRLAFMPGVRRGVPDDLFLIRGGVLGPPRVVFIEFKRPGKKPTELQDERLHELQNAGFCATWFSDAAAAIDYLARCAGLATTPVPTSGGGILNEPPQRRPASKARRA